MWPIRFRRHILVATTITLAFGVFVVFAQERSGGCLNSVEVGSQKVIPCDDTDPKQLANDSDVKTVMSVLNIAHDKVRFRGCEGSEFFASEDGLITTLTRSYLITYPTDFPGNYLAPITHELAHVYQMQQAGGYDALRVSVRPIKRIELGADYLTGFVFAQKHFPSLQFQTNLKLIGKYFEEDVNAHGTPSQRTAAFRFGFYSDVENRDVRQANSDFQENEYGVIQRM